MRRFAVLMATALLVAGCLGRAARYGASDPDPAPPAPTQIPQYVDVEADGRDVATEDRLVAFIRWRNRRLDPATARQIAVSLREAAAAFRIDERLIACLVAVESSFDPRARSRTGALGLGQILPATARELGISDPHDIDQNLRGTAGYLARMLAAWEGRRDLALVSYLEGLGTIRRQVEAGKPLTPAQQLFVSRVMGLYAKI